MLHALRGVRVLDMTRILAGPYATMLLADLGAEVIKIERPESGDEMRAMGPHFRAGESVYFMAVNRGKKSVCVDMSTEAGRAVIHDLAQVCDVAIENFRPGVADRLGVGWEALRAVNPKLIMCGMSAFGRTGPARDLPAFDLTLQARGGTMGITGEAGRLPVRMGPPMGDLAGGLYAALAIASALYERTRTGVGQYIDLALLDCQASLLVYAAAFWLTAGDVLGPQGSAHAHAFPYQAFETADVPIVVAVFTDRFWAPFCTAIDEPAWGRDPNYATHAQRRAASDVLLPAITAKLRTRTATEWLAALERAEVPCAPVNRVDGVFADRQLIARAMIAEMDHPAAGPVRAAGNPMKMGEESEWQNELHAPAPLLGADTERVLRDVLGYDDARIAALTTPRGVPDAERGTLTPPLPKG
jgi:crotonobetainyl-CoA:carnitine CoA-transferase CaiB-like acyl-CoA transferase